MLLMLLGGAAVGAVVSVLGRPIIDRVKETSSGPGAAVWLILGWVIAIAVHEAGHLFLAGRAGMRPVLYIVGPLRVSWEGSRPRVGFNSNLATWGGLSAAIPADTARLRERMMWLVAGGPLASLLLALVCFTVAALGTGSAAPVVMTGYMSLAIFIVTLLPMTAGGFMSDGAQLLALRRGGPEMEQRSLLIALSGASMAGSRPRDLDGALIARALQIPGSATGHAAAVLLAAMRSADRGEPDEDLFAELGSLYLKYPDGFRQNIALWMAWYVAAVRRDAAVARQWLARGGGGIVDAALRDLAEASVAGLSGDPESANRIAARGLKRSPGIDPGAGHLVRDLLGRRME